jgi:ubiquinone/menaquinone biosynthesis C-methylase UbiE
VTSNSLRDAFDRRADNYSSDRIDSFNEASRDCPSARDTERRHVIERLALRPGLTICDLGAGGGYLSDGIYDALQGNGRITCVENSGHFVESLPDRYEKVLSSLSSLDIRDASMDRAACLAATHHQEDKAQFFREVFRILKPGGLFVVGDGRAGTPTARFLNEAVTRHSDLPHDGIFYEPDGMRSLLEQAGFEQVREEYEEYTWDFPDAPTLVGYCKKLFRMTNADLPAVEEELRRYLGIEVSAAGARLKWSLVFGTGRKPSRATVS